MKKTQLLLVFAFILLSITTISAQYGNGYGNSYGGNGYGSGRSQMSQLPSEPEKPKEVPVDEIVGKMMEKMKTAVNLDALQEIAISNVMKESIKQQGVLMKQITNQEELENNYKILVETTDRKINEFLNPDQKEKYIAYKLDLKTDKKDKSKKKRRN